MGCCQSVNWKKMKEQIAKTLNLDKTFKDNNIKNEEENTVEISNINKTLDSSEKENKTEEENTVVDVEPSEEDFEII